MMLHLLHRCCDRRFGIGADGLILIQNTAEADFKMVYFNADGKESTLCGNGARCSVAFAAMLGIIENDTRFLAIDGLHAAKIDNDRVVLRMHDVDRINTFDHHYFLDTGSPHHVEMVEDLAHVPVVTKGQFDMEPYFEEGCNVILLNNMVLPLFLYRTYERGVEDETLSCGTGATAVALAMHHPETQQPRPLHSCEGELTISFKQSIMDISPLIYKEQPALYTEENGHETK